MNMKTLRSAILSRIVSASLRVVVAAWFLLLLGVLTHAQSPPSRPILFVYGYCDQSGSWDQPTSTGGPGMRSFLAAALNRHFPSLYPSAQAANYFDVYYDGTTVHFLQNGLPIEETSIPLAARYFSMNFFDPNSGTWSPAPVQQISILNKAEELAQVLREIERVTQISDVIVIAHSMGGLVSRTYLENMAATQPCYNYNDGVGGSPSYSAPCNAGADPYTGEIAELITIDTPHGGADLAKFDDWFLNDFFPNCSLGGSTTHTEQVPGSALLQNINYASTSIVSAAQIQSQVQVQAIESYFSDGNPPWEAFDPPFQLVSNDGLISLVNQSMESSITRFENPAQFTDSFNPQTRESVGAQTACFQVVLMLHLLTCVGSQPTTQGLVYSLVEPSIAGMPLSPLTTGSASNIQSDGATLHGTVNPNSEDATVWFEWSTSSTLQPYMMTPETPIEAGTATVPFSYAQGGLSANTTYYFRIAGSSKGVSLAPGSIHPFTTLDTLRQPTPLTPLNNSIGQTLTPEFGWTSVPTATDYRLIVATSPSALPRDPTLDTCSAFCVLGSTGVLVQGTTYAPPAGLLLPATTYYWEVHARSAAQFGTWSPIFSFTTSGSSPASDFSLQASPAAFSANPGGTATYLVTTTTAIGPSQSVTLSVSNLPNGISNASFSPASITSGMPATLTITLGSSVPTGEYALTLTGVGSSATHSMQVSLIVSAPASGPAATLTPSSQIFPAEAIGTASPLQTVSIRNSGGGQLIISGISVAAGSDYVYVLPPTLTFPQIVNPQVVISFQVYFQPSAIGPRTGQIYVWDNAPGSPQVFSFTGNGLAAPPTTGSVQVAGMLNGSPLPGGYGFSYTLTGPSTYSGNTGETFAVMPGAYTLSFNACCDLTLSSISPAATQTVSTGGQATFTMNFTAPNDFTGPYFAFPAGSSTTQIIPAPRPLNPHIYGAFSPRPWASAGPAPGPGNRGRFRATQGRFRGRREQVRGLFTRSARGCSGRH